MKNTLTKNSVLKSGSDVPSKSSPIDLCHEQHYHHNSHDLYFHQARRLCHFRRLNYTFLLPYLVLIKNIGLASLDLASKTNQLAN